MIWNIAVRFPAKARDFIILKTKSRQTSAPTQPHIKKKAQGAFALGKKRPEREAEHRLHMTQRLRMPLL